MLRLLLFRRANQILELEKGNVRFIDVFASEYEELEYATTLLPKEDKFGNTNGFYSNGVKGDILMFYVEGNKPIIQYGDKVCEILDEETKFSCYQINEQEWCFECLSPNNSFLFTYMPYVYDPYDDDDESDVNFGLWLMSLIQDIEKLNRVIKANINN